MNKIRPLVAYAGKSEELNRPSEKEMTSELDPNLKEANLVEAEEVNQIVPVTHEEPTRSDAVAAMEAQENPTITAEEHKFNHPLADEEHTVSIPSPHPEDPEDQPGVIDTPAHSHPEAQEKPPKGSSPPEPMLWRTDRSPLSYAKTCSVTDSPTKICSEMQIPDDSFMSPYLAKDDTLLKLPPVALIVSFKLNLTTVNNDFVILTHRQVLAAAAC